MQSKMQNKMLELYDLMKKSGTKVYFTYILYIDSNQSLQNLNHTNFGMQLKIENNKSYMTLTVNRYGPGGNTIHIHINNSTRVEKLVGGFCLWNNLINEVIKKDKTGGVEQYKSWSSAEFLEQFPQFKELSKHFKKSAAYKKDETERVKPNKSQSGAEFLEQFPQFKELLKHSKKSAAPQPITQPTANENKLTDKSTTVATTSVKTTKRESVTNAAGSSSTTLKSTMKKIKKFNDEIQNAFFQLREQGNNYTVNTNSIFYGNNTNFQLKNNSNTDLTNGTFNETFGNTTAFLPKSPCLPGLTAGVSWLPLLVVAGAVGAAVIAVGAVVCRPLLSRRAGAGLNSEVDIRKLYADEATLFISKVNTSQVGK
ncbi:MAG: hypothetical protein QWI36_05090 [Wolbachia endosymbiont of Tyrophagus putrescentiae]|nr:hypothetical protein [Wolbachia endosymbiont of Tyrophagus putrescentiae]